jgi:DNA-binding NtrC family response regulator
MTSIEASARRDRRRYVVLLIDDDELPRHELRRAFEVTGEFEFEVHEACSAQEYHQVIRDHHIDVLVVDLRLGAGEEGTDDIITLHHVLSPDTVIIAFSGFPGLDPVQTCVRAMRAGAADCIEKSRRDGVEAVVKRAVAELRQRIAPESAPTSAWLERHLPDLVREHAGHAVAFAGECLIASAPTVPELRKKLAGLELSVPPYLMVIPKWDDCA